jgi:hypothetical protein
MYGVAVDTRIHLQDTMARVLVVEAEPLVAIVLECALRRDRKAMVASGIGGANLTIGVNNGRRNA